MSPLRSRRRRPRSSSFLLVALGALTGLALGAVLSDRVGGLDGLLKKNSKKRRKGETTSYDHDELAEAAAADHADVDHDYAEESESDRVRAAGRGPFANDDDDDTYDDGAEDYDDESDTSTVSMSDLGKRAVPDETELEERVLEAFHNDPILAERAIDIGAIGTGVIELTGWVQASWEIGHAVTLARGVPDVTTVVDRLAVRDGEKRRDHSGRAYSGDAKLDAAPADGALPRAD